MKKNLALVFSILMIGAACNRQSPAQTSVGDANTSTYNQKLIIGGKNLKVEIVSTPEKMALGLSGREKMGEDEGMLFVFAKPGIYTFWVKNMKFDLDLIWIANGKIIGITKNVSAPSAKTKIEELPRYNPPLPADEVLEVNANWADRNKINIGDKIKLNQK